MIQNQISTLPESIFPNFELCSSDVVNAASEEVNLHIIFSPFEAGLEANIKQFLQSLETNKTS
jgi:hypothetical protein